MQARDAAIPTLVILAAGASRRYGGLKQLEPIGPTGETIPEYAIYDARRAGFGRVVLVVRPDTEALFRATLTPRLPTDLSVTYAHQRLDDLPPGVAPPPTRTKPWGTGHAVLAAANSISGPFAVINADDFYGASAYAALAAFLRDIRPAGPPTAALVGYPLHVTLPAEGAVARAVCQISADGWLVDINEVLGIERTADGGRYRDANGQWSPLAADTTVSMNLWGFDYGLVAEIRDAWVRFLADERNLEAAEFYLPHAIRAALRAGRLRVRVLPAGTAWCGLTNPADRARTVEYLRQCTLRGDYPPCL